MKEPEERQTLAPQAVSADWPHGHSVHREDRRLVCTDPGELTNMTPAFSGTEALPGRPRGFLHLLLAGTGPYADRPIMEASKGPASPWVA
jgi:hypothetical protein